MKKSIFLISIVATIYLSGCNHAAKHDHEHSETDHVHEQKVEDHHHDEAEINGGKTLC